MNRLQVVAFFRVVVGLLFALAGIMHFLKPNFYVAIVPPYLPHPLALVEISGVFEILGGIGLLMPGIRRLAGYGLMALLIAVFPANIHMLVQSLREHGLSWVMVLFLRLPLQFVFIAIVNRVSKYR